MTWTDVASLADLQAQEKTVVRHDGRQILLLHTPKGVFACANRCPHEGYPLSEGQLADGCVLTCNWHNWKFDLSEGATLVGGDRLPQFPVRLDGGRVLLDLTPPDPTAQRGEFLRGVVKALEDADQQRLVRETARLMRIGCDPLDAVRSGVQWVSDRLEFGTTHAVAGASEWLALAERADTAPDERLAAFGEILGHIADEVRNGRRFPFAAGEAPWDEAAFLAAIEAEDEAAACARLRGALAVGMTGGDLLPALVTAALSHYADFGHSLIYAVNTVRLLDRLGPGSAEPLLLMLVRSLVFATREDLLPEFRDYAGHLAAWGNPGAAAPLRDPPALNASALRGRAAKSAMATVAAWGAHYPPEAIFTVLVEAAAWTLLHVDEQMLTRPDGKLADNITWLDFTHALTFADAARTAVRLRPALWPAVLLQLACFNGRNAGYVDAQLDVRHWEIDGAIGGFDDFAATAMRLAFDHGRDRFIISVHLTKTLLAGAALGHALPELAPLLGAALNRFLHARMKGRHVLRTARQMLELVEQE